MHSCSEILVSIVLHAFAAEKYKSWRGRSLSHWYFVYHCWGQFPLHPFRAAVFASDRPQLRKDSLELLENIGNSNHGLYYTGQINIVQSVSKHRTRRIR